MCKKLKKFGNCLVITVLTFAFVLGAVPPTRVYAFGSFTYTYSIWGVPIPSPDAYRVTAYILGEHLGVGHFNSPQDLFVIYNLIYVCIWQLLNVEA